MTRLMAALTLFLCPPSLLADNSIQTRWEQLCSASGGRKLSISTLDGKTIHGKCVSTDATELRLNLGSDNVVSVERSAIKQITARDHHLALATVWGYCFVAMIATAYTAWPLDIVVAPIAVGAGVVASPFALMLDLFELTSDDNIEITP